MKDSHQEIAQDFYHIIIKKLKVKYPQIEGSGENASCRLRLKNYICYIDCSERNEKVEYSICFQNHDTLIAKGYTHSKQKTIQSITTWLTTGKRSLLYEKFTFVDHEKRSFIKLAKKILNLAPQLRPLGKLGKNQWSQTICFTKGEREVLIWGYSDYKHQQHFTANFIWDITVLFRVPIQDLPFFVQLLQQWLMKGSLPSELKREYPWLEIDRLAEYYERGEGLTGEFVESWESMTQFYKEEMRIYLGDEISDLMINFINTMKAEGYNRLLRAGQSLSSLILSRSKKHGNLNSLYVVFMPKSSIDSRENRTQTRPIMKIEYHVNGKISTQFEEEIALTNRIRKVLNHLSQQPIQ